MGSESKSIHVSVFAYTDVGRHRSGNEDAFLIADLTTGKVGLRPDMVTHKVGERGSLLVVSDGMGGALAGEVASELAVTTIRESLLQIPTDMGAYQRLKLATEVANEVIWNEGQRDASLAGMGATVTAALVQGSAAHIAQVGDSRAYMIRGGQIKQITKDQSYAQMLVDSGLIKPEEMELVPKNVIAQALGAKQAIDVALTSVQLCRNDYLVLCSDGLSGKIEAEEIRQVIVESSDLGFACRQLIQIANDRGGEDNITVVIASFDGQGLEAVRQGKTITESFQALGSSSSLEEEPAGAGTLPLTSAGPPPEQKAAAVAAAVAPSPEVPTEEIEPPPTDEILPPPLTDEIPPLPPTEPLAPPDNPTLADLQPGVTVKLGSSKPPARPRTFGILGVASLLLLLLAAAYVIYKFVLPELD